MATNQVDYISQSDIRDIYPNIDKYDTKRPIYGWVTTGTSNFYKAYNTGLINVLFFDGIEGTAVTDDPDANYEFRYSEGNDSVEVFINTGSPADMLMESGEDWSNHLDDIRYKASRYVDSWLDSSMPRTAWKNDEDQYDYVLVRTTAMVACYFLISAHDPENEDGLKLKEEYEAILDKINAGDIKLGFEISADSSQGIIRELVASGTLKPVDLRGKYYGNSYDKIRLQVIDAGVIGTSSYSVWVFGNDKLGINQGSQVVTAQKITGEYQDLAGGLQVRFGGSTRTGTDGGTADILNNSAAANDLYEIEVWSVGMEQQDSRQMRSINAVRV